VLHQRNEKIRGKKMKQIHPETNVPPRKNISPVIFLETDSKKSRVFGVPLPRNAQKRTTNNYVRTFFASWRRRTSFSRFIFSAAPCEKNPRRTRTRTCGLRVYIAQLAETGFGFCASAF
jgi:hypothetical protein